MHNHADIRPLNFEARINPCGTFGQRDTGTGFFPSPSVFPCQHHSTVVLYTHVSSEGRTTGPLVAAVQRHSLNSFNMNMKHADNNLHQQIHNTYRMYKTPTDYIGTLNNDYIKRSQGHLRRSNIYEATKKKIKFKERQES
jgi:hypothetical protein